MIRCLAGTPVHRQETVAKGKVRAVRGCIRGRGPVPSAHTACIPLGVSLKGPVGFLQSEVRGVMGLKLYLDAIGSGTNRISEIAWWFGMQATTGKSVSKQERRK